VKLRRGDGMAEWMLEENGPLMLDVDTGATVGELSEDSDEGWADNLVELHNRDIRELRTERDAALALLRKMRMWVMGERGQDGEYVHLDVLVAQIDAVLDI